MMGKRVLFLISNVPKLYCFAIIMQICATGVLGMKHTAYHEVITEIDESVPVANCSDILKLLEATLTKTSHHLYVALDGLAYFHSISIILPNSWPDQCLPANISIDRSRGDPSDLTITAKHLLFGDKIWTQQSGRCGERGDQIFATFNSLNRSGAAKEFAKEWIKYYYGVFDEMGYVSDEIYPLCYTSDKQYITGCSNVKIADNGFCDSSNKWDNLSELIRRDSDSSLMFLPQIENLIKICNESTHDRLAPTKHNLLCDRQSVREIIMKNTDFMFVNNRGGFGKSKPQTRYPIISYKKRALTRYVVVIDETQDIFVRESWSFLRNAIRKWLIYDLQPNTEVGIVLANETSADKILELTGLDLVKNRDLVASFIPYIPGDSSQSACIICGIREGLKLLSNKRSSHGFASEVLIVIAPGMDYQLDYKSMVDWATENRTRVVTINFPTLNRREPLDILAHMTGGEAFTVLEQKYNNEKSFLNTYFDLATVLFHISCKFFEGPKSQLPVEIHRKELVDKVNDSNSSKRNSRVISGNFYFDEGLTTPSGFYIYTHNVEVPLIQNVRLTSPGGASYGTRSDERIPVKQITIVASVNQSGPWSYRIERFNGNPQPHFVQVLATPSDVSASVVRARAWIRQPESGGPLILYCEVKRGGYPVHSAYVEAQITRPNVQCNYTNNCVERLKLLDTGSGDPDIVKGDGIYSRYFSTKASGPGLYRFDILADDNGNTAYALPLNSERGSVEGLGLECCGSVISDVKTKQIPPFQRHLPQITIMVNRSETEADFKATVGRIGDLTGAHVGDGKIRLTWTAPDIGGHTVSKYEVRYALNFFDIINNFDTVASIWPHASPYLYSIGDVTNFLVDTKLEPTLYGSSLYLAIRPFSKFSSNFIPGPISNPVRVFVPAPVKPTTPSLLDSPDGINNDEDSNYEGTDNLLGAGRSPIRSNNVKEYSIAIAVAMFLIGIIIIIYLIFCITQRRRRRAKRNGLCNTNVPHTAIETIPCEDTIMVDSKLAQISSVTNENMNTWQEEDQSKNQLNLNSQNYQSVESPDHHVVGLPLCPDRSEYQKKDVMGRFTPTLYSSACGTISVISTNDNTLTRQGRMLSPYESWTATQLLHEHECRVSPVRDLLGQFDHTVMHYDAPPVPPLPYHIDSTQLYSETVNEADSQHPPGYSTIRRNGAPPLSHTSPKTIYSQNSLASSCTVQDPTQNPVNPGEKKRRNITMV